MTSRQGFEKVSLTIEADVLHRVRDRVEPGKVSAFATLPCGGSWSETGSTT